MGDLENSYRIDPDLVKKELLQVLSSDKFRNSQVLSMFLQFVVEEMLAGHANEIKEYTIGIRALGRPVDFNPQIDAVVRIHAGRLRRMLNEYYEGEGAKDFILISMPRGSYIPIFRYRNDEKIVTLPLIVPEERLTPPQRKATVAVFPFHNRSSDDTKDYFVEGMGEQLCSDLARFQYLSVISYYSTYRLAVENKKIREIHEALNIDYIVTGSIRFSAGLIQINVELMLAETDALLWTHTYIRHFNSDNLYNVQDEIIEEVVNKIADNDGIIIRDIAHTRRRNPYGVYEAVYLYYGFRGSYDPDVFNQSLSALEHASLVDPENALIWALLAKLYLNNYMFQVEPSPQHLVKGIAYTEKAMWLDQNCQYANKALAWVYLLTGKKEDCFEAIERCLDVNSKAPSITGSMGFLLICIGKYTLGFRLLLKTMHLNPAMAWYCNLGFALYYYHNGEFDDAYNWTRRSGSPDMPWMTLVKIAAMRKMKEGNFQLDTNEFPEGSKDLVDRAPDIIQHFIHDEQLREKLLKDLAWANLAFD